MYSGLIGNIGTGELLVIALVMLLLFGRRLPEVMRSLGRGVTEFKKGLHDAASEETLAVNQNPSQKTDGPSKPDGASPAG